jgi:hypothetical protein
VTVATNISCVTNGITIAKIIHAMANRMKRAIKMDMIVCPV